MATTLTPRGQARLGAGMVMDYGDYSTDGSTTATLSVSGGYVITAQFMDANQNPLDALSSPAVALSAKALSGSVTSYTVTPSSGAVTGGTYFIIHGGL
jgi:hypothetical protein